MNIVEEFAPRLDRSVNDYRKEFVAHPFGETVRLVGVATIVSHGARGFFVIPEPFRSSVLFGVGFTAGIAKMSGIFEQKKKSWWS